MTRGPVAPGPVPAHELRRGLPGPGPAGAVAEPLAPEQQDLREPGDPVAERRVVPVLGEPRRQRLLRHPHARLGHAPLRLALLGVEAGRPHASTQFPADRLKSASSKAKAPRAVRRNSGLPV